MAGSGDAVKGVRVDCNHPSNQSPLRSSVWLVALNQNRERFQCIGVSGSPYERHVVVIHPFRPMGLLRFVRGGKEFPSVNDIDHRVLCCMDDQYRTMYLLDLVQIVKSVERDD